MVKWLKMTVVGLLLTTGFTMAQDNPYLQIVVNGLSGAEVDGTWPNQAGVGHLFTTPLDASTATSLSMKVKMVGTATGGAVQARIYLKTGSEYDFFTSETFTDLASGTQVEVEALMAELLLPAADSVMEIGIMFTTSNGISFSGDLQLDDIILTTEAGETVIEDFSEGPMGWEEVDVGGELGSVITLIKVPGIVSEPSGNALHVAVEGLDGASVIDEDEIETWPNLGGVGIAFGSEGEDFSGATHISIQLMATGGEIPAGSALQARIFLKTGAWTWSTTSGARPFIDLKKDKWVTLNVPIKDFNAEAIEDITNVNELGLQFQTYEMVYTGEIVFDDVVLKKPGGNDTLFNFELGIDGWAESQVTSDDVYQKGKIVKKIYIPGYSTGGEGAAMAATYVGLSGIEVVDETTEESSWPYQGGIEITDQSFDFSDKTKLSVAVAPDQEILPGTAVQARIFVKTGEDWLFSSCPYVDLKGKEWTLVEVKIDRLSPAVEDKSMFRSIGIQFFTQELEYSGKILIDNFKVDDTVLYKFEDETSCYDWSEADVGQIPGGEDGGEGGPFRGIFWLTAEEVAAIISATDIRHSNEPRTISDATTFSVRQLAKGSAEVNFTVNADQEVTLALFDISGRLAYNRTLFAKKGRTTVILQGFDHKAACGSYVVSLSTPQGRMVRKLNILQ